MGKRDFRRRESKKPKKDTKKVSAAGILRPPMTTEIIKKSRKERKEGEE